MAGALGRNDLCPCGSGLKFKKCCQSKTPQPQARARPLSRSPPGGAASLLTVATTHWAAGRMAEAIATFRQIVKLEPDNVDAIYNLGAALFGNGQLAEAATCLARAVELRPGFEAALRTLANTQEHLGREAEAAALYRRLSRVARDPMDRRLTLAKALGLEGASNDAEVELRRAVAAAPANAGAQVLLGQHLLEQGEFAEAEGYLVRAIDEFPDAFQHLAVSRRFTESDRPLLDRVSALLAQKDLGQLQRGAAHFGLGKAHDDLRDYAEAMRHFEAGNTLCGASRRLDRAGLVAHYDNLVADYASLAAGAHATPGGADPDPEADLPILIVGMPRSGTTLVEQILSSHPLIDGGGELSFWSDRVKQWQALPDTMPTEQERASPAAEAIAKLMTSRLPRTAVEKASLTVQARRPAGLAGADPARLSHAARDYYAVLRQIGPQARRVIDKAPFNFERLGQIRMALPKARIIHCRRGAADTCLSMYFTNYKGRQAWSRADLLFQYRQYERLMAHWRAVLPADRFIEVDYEAVISDREAQTRRLIAFCGLDWDAACLAPEQNQRVVKSASVWQARQPAYTRSLDRWRNYEPWLGEFRELLPDGG